MDENVSRDPGETLYIEDLYYEFDIGSGRKVTFWIGCEEPCWYGTGDYDSSGKIRAGINRPKWIMQEVREVCERI